MRTVTRFGPFCKRAGMSVRHFERLCAEGKGPPIIELGDRIRGLFDDDGDAWLATRRKAPPGWVDPVLTDAIEEADADARTEAHRVVRTPAA
jgi:hypothetical protein